MRLLIRLLLLIVLCSYLLRHNGGFVGEYFRPMDSTKGGETLKGLAQISDDHFRSGLAQANLPPGVLPRHDLTPGAIDPHVTQSNIRNTICRRGYTATVRPPFEYTNAMKHRLMRIYGVTGSIHDYELDHLIPLELGGCPNCEANVWPEPRNVFPGASEKDEVERYLHEQVCSSEMPLAEAQQQIAADWYAVYRKVHSGR